ncbi:MAG TPA: hypothetical protein VM715_11710, partial [Candidatus Acidoferrum sp.]|nr:hypothetical protein [Candidatus Acidoferrum sp.]
YWICALIAVVSFVFSLMQGSPLLAITLLLFFYFGGVGVRQRDPLAAGMVFLFYAVDTVTTVFFMVFASPWGMSVFRILVTALLLSNVRATWIASKWKTDSEEAALPPRLNETWSDKFVDQLPTVLWPKARIAYYVFGACVLTLVSIGLASMLARSIIRGMS